MHPRLLRVIPSSMNFRINQNSWKNYSTKENKGVLFVSHSVHVSMGGIGDSLVFRFHLWLLYMAAGRWLGCTYAMSKMILVI